MEEEEEEEEEKKKKKNVYRLLVGKRPLARPGRRWVYNIKIGLGEIEWGGMDWISLSQDRNRLESSCGYGN
jgi:hypothetical protein